MPSQRQKSEHSFTAIWVTPAKIKVSQCEKEDKLEENKHSLGLSKMRYLMPVVEPEYHMKYSFVKLEAEISGKMKNRKAFPQFKQRVKHRSLARQLSHCWAII